MFVQGPALMIQQRSDNSEEDSDEEGSGDVLQVNFYLASYSFVFQSLSFFFELGGMLTYTLIALLS